MSKGNATGGPMSQVYNPESDIIAEIERLEMEARSIRRRVEHVRNEQDKRVLNRQLQELKEQIEFLKNRLP
jgi:peptidoglycan hydrolase CwlO-like protein